MDSENYELVKFYLTATNISHMLVKTVKKELNSHLKRHNLNYKHWLVMEMIYFNKANTPTKISDRVGLDISTLSRLLDQMESRLLIVKEGYEFDKRISIIKLTEQGNHQIKMGLQIFTNLPDKFKETLNKDELETFIQVERLFLKSEQEQFV